MMFLFLLFAFFFFKLCEFLNLKKKTQGKRNLHNQIKLKLNLKYYNFK